MREPEPSFPFALTVNPWDLHKRSRRDIARHTQKVRDAIRGNLPEIISREDIITSDGQKIVKVPVRGVELPRFRFNPHSQEHIGQGQGDTQPGTVLGQEGGEGSGKGKKAGHSPGQDIYETEITVDGLIDLAFEELGLPNLEDKGKEQLTETTLQYDTIRKTGPQANLDKRRTLVEAFKRNARLGRPSWEIDPNQDSRYKSWEEVQKPIKNAVVLAMRDVSGSMGEFESFISRTFYTWMTRFLRRCYAGVDIAFITCHTEAQEVDEDTFFKLGGSGGTRMSSAYQLALEVIRERYNPEIWNIYPFLFSDGENWGDEECVDLVGKLVRVSNLVGYGEIQNYGYWAGATMPAGSDHWAPLGRAYKKAFADEPRFSMVQISKKEDVWPALKHFLRVRHQEIAG
ncbi:DUF444 family protein [Candidatus Daviesbacteria bacterium]|nr:DUF444 family protein [Candidatus Daviesbacteria bacterium]